MDEKRKVAGAVLKNLRHEYGMSQDYLAAAVSEKGTHMTDRHYRRIEQGRVTPSVLLAMSICDVLDTNIYEVWG
jgi:DNA-binding XRE family transcriptional regulator